MEKQGSRILLADREVCTLQTLSGALSAAGYAFYHVGSGREALREFQLLRPDLILIDGRLPDLSSTLGS